MLLGDWSSDVCSSDLGDALALRGDERRDKLRKATGIGTHDMIRRYLNGATHYVEDIVHR